MTNIVKNHHNQYLISAFDQDYDKILTKHMSLQSEILPFKLLAQAKLTNEGRLLVLTRMNCNDQHQLYELAPKIIKESGSYLGFEYNFDFVAHVLFWASGDNLGLKHLASSCKQAAFGAGVQKKQRALKLAKGP